MSSIIKKMSLKEFQKFEEKMKSLIKSNFGNELGKSKHEKFMAELFSVKNYNTLINLFDDEKPQVSQNIELAENDKNISEKDKKWHKTTYKIEVLSEEPYFETSLSQISYDMIEGENSGAVDIVKQEKLSIHEIEEALLNQGSDPSFFPSIEEHHLEKDRILFLNYFYKITDGSVEEIIKEFESSQQYYIQLFNRMVDDKEFEDLDLLYKRLIHTQYYPEKSDVIEFIKDKNNE